MKLIGSLTSPYVRKVRVVLAEKKIEYEFELDSPWSPESNVPNINPLGKIPVLVLDEETTLFDSRVISEYLDNVAPNNKLMPAPNRERTEVKRWEALADGICDAAALIFLEKKRPAERQDADWIARQESKLIRGLDYMAEAAGRQRLVHGHPLLPGRYRHRMRARLPGVPLPRDRLERQAPESRTPVRQADAAPGVRRYAQGMWMRW
jgi:glutathione S-transferase